MMKILIDENIIWYLNSCDNFIFYSYFILCNSNLIIYHINIYNNNVSNLYISITLFLQNNSYLFSSLNSTIFFLWL